MKNHVLTEGCVCGDRGVSETGTRVSTNVSNGLIWATRDLYSQSSTGHQKIAGNHGKSLKFNESNGIRVIFIGFPAFQNKFETFAFRQTVLQTS